MRGPSQAQPGPASTSQAQPGTARPSNPARQSQPGAALGSWRSLGASLVHIPIFLFRFKNLVNHGALQKKPWAGHSPSMAQPGPSLGPAEVVGGRSVGGAASARPQSTSGRQRNDTGLQKGSRAPKETQRPPKRYHKL